MGKALLPFGLLVTGARETVVTKVSIFVYKFFRVKLLVVELGKPNFETRIVVLVYTVLK
jgi:hypothetical protein